MAFDRSQKYVVLLNGPPGCGKDLVASHLVQYLQFERMKFSAPIKRMAAGLLNISLETVERLKETEFNTLSKETKAEDGTFGTERFEYGPKDTLRQLLIRLSEEFLKPTYGNTFFGRIAVKELQRSSYPLIIFTDSGFNGEAATVTRAIGRGNTILIRLHREGCDFKHDSRSYLKGIAGEERDIENNGPIAYTAAQVAVAIRNHFGIKLLKEIEL
jgi:hypothetical protein